MPGHSSPSQTPRFRVFLSHAGEDKETIARPLFKRFQEHGLTVFFDEESFDYGDHCPEVMDRAMETAPVGMFIMSPEFVAKNWPMRELLAFVRRYDHAKKHIEKPPLLIPVFYRFSSGQCRDSSIFDTYSALFVRHGLYQRAFEEVVPLKDVMHALDIAATLWGPRNDFGATNSDKPDMAQNRENFINSVQNRILPKLGIESLESSGQVPPPTIQGQPAPPDEYIVRDLVPPNPPRLTLNYDTLSTCEGRLKAAVLRGTESGNVAVLAIGMGGVGKTCALRGLAKDSKIIQVFRGGRLYLELGRNATPQHVIRGIASIVERTGGANLAGRIRTAVSVPEASRKASEWFGERPCLFLLDSIWHVNGIDSKVLENVRQIGGSSSVMVGTTRDVRFQDYTEKLIKFEEKEACGDLSRQMLMRHADLDESIKLKKKNELAFKKFLTLCQGLPVGFGVVGSKVRRYSSGCSPKEDAWLVLYNQVSSKLENFMGTNIESYGSLTDIVDASLQVLESRKNLQQSGYRFRALSVLERQQCVPIEMLQKLWSLISLRDAIDMAESFFDVSVVHVSRSERSRFVKLHDLFLEVAVSQATEKKETRSFFQTLLHNYMACGEGKHKDDSSRGSMSDADWELCYAWWEVKDDGYIRGNVCRLLRKAGYVEQLLWLLSQPQWIVKRLVEDRIQSLENDLEHGIAVSDEHFSQHAGYEEHLRMVGLAGRMSAMFVEKNPRVEEAWFQLHTRLQLHATQNEWTNEFLKSMERCAPKPWLKGSTGFLQQVGCTSTPVVTVSGRVLCTREEHDATWILSQDDSSGLMHVGRYDKQNECYKNGRKFPIEERSHIQCASFLRDHRRAMTAYEDGRIRQWNMETGACENVVTHDNVLHGSFVDFLAHGTRVACQTADYSIQLRDTLSSEPLGQLLRGHTDEVTSVAVSADGTRIVSGSLDKTVRVWDAHTGNAVGLPLHVHSGEVMCVGVSANGLHVASQDSKMLRLWALNASGGKCVLTNRHDEWQHVINSLELTWAGANCSSQLEVCEYEDDGSKIVLGSCEEFVFNIRGSDVYFVRETMRACRILR